MPGALNEDSGHRGIRRQASETPLRDSGVRAADCEGYGRARFGVLVDLQGFTRLAGSWAAKMCPRFFCSSTICWAYTPDDIAWRLASDCRSKTGSVLFRHLHVATCALKLAAMLVKGLIGDCHRLSEMMAAT